VIDQRGRQTDVLRRKQREFRAGIIKQIDEKQEERINAGRARYQEGVKLEEEAKLRRQRLEEAKTRKLNELRSVCSVATPSTNPRSPYIYNSACFCQRFLRLRSDLQGGPKK